MKLKDLIALPLVVAARRKGWKSQGWIVLTLDRSKYLYFDGRSKKTNGIETILIVLQKHGSLSSDWYPVYVDGSEIPAWYLRHMGYTQAEAKASVRIDSEVVTAKLPEVPTVQQFLRAMSAAVNPINTRQIVFEAKKSNTRGLRVYCMPTMGHNAKDFNDRIQLFLLDQKYITQYSVKRNDARDHISLDIWACAPWAVEIERKVEEAPAHAARYSRTYRFYEGAEQSHLDTLGIQLSQDWLDSYTKAMMGFLYPPTLKTVTNEDLDVWLSAQSTVKHAERHEHREDPAPPEPKKATPQNIVEDLKAVFDKMCIEGIIDLSKWENYELRPTGAPGQWAFVKKEPMPDFTAEMALHEHTFGVDVRVPTKAPGLDEQCWAEDTARLFHAALLAMNSNRRKEATDLASANYAITVALDKLGISLEK